jgi:hypothetical protein
VAEYVSAGKRIELPKIGCPTCQRELSGWGWYRRWLRRAGEEFRLWVRRGICRTCKRTHGLLPEFVHIRRLDAVDVIGPALETNIAGTGMAKVAAEHLVPFSTARDWRRRHRRRGASLLAQFTELAVGLGDRLESLPMAVEAAAMAALGAAWRQALRRWGELVPELWRFWNAVCGGSALANNTSSPLSAARGPGWMPASPPRRL